jgi:hypothetical protein
MELHFRITDYCGVCECDSIVFVQVARLRETDSGTYSVISSAEMQERMVTGSDPAYNGWAVDREEGAKFAFYGMLNLGQFNSNSIPGNSSGIDAVLGDKPSDPQGRNLFWEFIDVPVCIDTEHGCGNKILGYFYWTMLSGDRFARPTRGGAQYWHPTAVSKAIDAWNAQPGKMPVPLLAQP